MNDKAAMLPPMTKPAAHVLDTVTMLGNSDEIKEVLRSPLFIQATGPIGTPFRYPDAINYIDGQQHLARRRLEAPLFSEDSLQSYWSGSLQPSIWESLRELLPEADDDGVVRTDLIPLMWRIVYRVGARLIGIDDVDSRERIDQLVDIAQALTDALSVEWAPPAQVERIIERGLAAEEAYGREFFEPSKARRLALLAEVDAGRLDPDDLPGDLITALHRNLNPDWDEGTPFRECCMYIVGTTSSSTQAIPHFLVLLDEWLEAHPESRRRVLEDPTFLRRAGGEALRFFLSNPLRFRRAAEDVVLRSGRTVRAGEVVGVKFREANMETGVFGDDAEEFDPFREVRGHPWGLAFGSGPHSCLGRPLVTGTGHAEGTDGSMAAIARALFEAGFEFDRARESVVEEERGKRLYISLPIRLTKLQEAIDQHQTSAQT